MILRCTLLSSILLCACGAGNGNDAGVRTPTGDPDSGTSAVVVDAARDAVLDVAPGRGNDSGPVRLDASPETATRVLDASIDAGHVDACTGSVAVTGGTVAGASTLAFGATLLESGAWSVSSLPTNVEQAPAIVAFQGGFAAAFVDAVGDLEFATSTWTWSSPSALGGVVAKGTPSLAVVGSDLHVVYQGSSGKFFHGIYSPGSGWDQPIDPVGGSEQGFGPSAPAAATIAGELVVAYAGQDGWLYDQTWSAGAWTSANPHMAAQTGQLTPSVVALQGGASDTLVVYVDPTGVLQFTARAAGAWSAPVVINTDAFTGASPSLAPLSGGRAVMAYLGTNNLPYFSVYDPATAPPWTHPAAMAVSSPELASPPAIAAGMCGDDAIATLVEPAGVAAVRYVGGAWTAPTMLEGTAGMTYAAVASQP
jgi:hypothetical protein